MAMPRKLKLVNVFLNSYSYQGVAKSVMLPKLTRKLKNYCGAEMNGSAPADLDLDDDALSIEWSLGSFPNSVIRELCAVAGVGVVPIRFTGSYQRGDTGETVAIEVVMRGHQKEINTGEGKQGENTESKISVVCTYFRLMMDGRELVKVGTISMIEKVNGIDRLEQHRHSIGLRFSSGQLG